MEHELFQGMDYVYAVYQEGSFQGAARKLLISQPSVSASVKRVEDKIGFPLFDRSVKPLKLTAFGERYIASVEQIYSVQRQFGEYINDVDTLRRGTLKVGGSALFSSMLLPPMITKFSGLYPQVELETIEETTANLVEMLKKGTIDFLIDYQRGYSDADFDWKPMEQEDIILAVPKQFAINTQLTEYQLNPSALSPAEILRLPPVPLQAFAKEPFILLKHGNDTRLRADTLCAAGGFAPKAIMELDQQMSSYLVSCSGTGITFVSSLLLSRLTPNPSLYYYRLEGAASHRKIMIFWKHGRYITRAMDAFLKLIES